MPETEQSTEVSTVTANPASFKEFDTPLGELTAELAELQQRKPDAEGNITRMTVGLFQEWDTRAKAYLEAAEKSPQRQTVKKARAVWEDLSAWFKKATEPVTDGREWASDHIFGPYDAQTKARVAKEQREREAAAKAEQERQRAEEVAHLKEQGHKEEAKELKAAPLPPVSLPPSKIETRLPGRVTVEVFKLKEIVDAKLLAGYLVEHPEDLISLFEPKAGEWKRRQTSAKGKWIVPGVIFSKETETRNRG